MLNTSKIINGGSIDLGEYASKVRVIPFKSLGKDNGLLLGIKIDEAYIEYQDNVYEIKNVIIGIYNGILSRNRKYVGLVGLDVINE